jgi:hypothetical protein
MYIFPYPISTNLDVHSAEIVKWVMESMWPFSIVEDKGFQTLMKTGHPLYQIPSAATVARDIKEVFQKTKKQIVKYLQVGYLATVSQGTFN